MKKVKICRKCKEEQNIDQFCKSSRSRNGLNSMCRSCIHDKYLATKDSCISRVKEWTFKNKKHRQKYLKQYRQKNLSKLKKYDKARRQEFYDFFVEYDRQYYQDNKETINAKIKERKKRDPQFRITGNLRSYLSLTLRRAAQHNSDKTVNLLGCSFKELKEHIESQFSNGMSWDNYGRSKDKWSIDHIRPCVSFDLSDPDEQKACFCYTNLQPLWNIDNWSKNSLYKGKYIRKKTLTSVA